MILDEVVLHNFGVYGGRQSFKLTPEGHDRPIVLIGAQNGAGKTTFLEGLQLAFYGRLGRPSLRGSSGYDEYLRNSINRSVPPTEGAEIQVTFRRKVAGREQTFMIRRAWATQGKGVREVFEAVVDGKLDRVLTEQWAEFVDEMLPPRIAALFFFDGEKIEQFADLDRSSEIVGTAIHALLGLDIVERLQLDLEVLERRKAAATGSVAVRTELSALEAEADDAAAAERAARDELAAATTRRDRCTSLLARARTSLQSQGGDIFASHETLSADRARLEGALEQTRRELRSWAGDCAPLLLVPGLLSSMEAQSDRETETEATRALLARLGERDQRTLDALKRFGAIGELLTSTGAFLDEDRDRLALEAKDEPFLRLSSTARMLLGNLNAEGATQARLDRDAILEQLDRMETQKDDLERQLTSIPAPETIAPLVNAFAEAKNALLRAEADLLACKISYESAEREFGAARARYQTKLDHVVKMRLQQEDAHRLIQHSTLVRETLNRFRTEVIRHHVRRIEGHMLEALRELLRKDDLVASVKIDPETFVIELRDGGWEVLPPEQLSAGERQLFAVALLWALAKASGQAAPTVVDTPLGRLDSQHRSRLAERYFPRAGHQVVLLSTDEEIDARMYATLEPYISRSFTVVYDPGARGSRIEPGYAFTARAGLEAA